MCQKENRLIWTILLVWISYSEHVRYAQTNQNILQILIANSKLGILVCVRFAIIFCTCSFGWFFRRDPGAWSHKSLKTSPLIRKVFRFETGFLSVWVIRKKCVRLLSTQNRSSLDVVCIQNFWPSNKCVRVTKRGSARTKFQYIFPWRQGDE